MLGALVALGKGSLQCWALGFPWGRAAIPAVVGALGLDTAALGALVDHFSRLQLQTLHVLFSGIPFGYCPLWFNNNVF